MSKYYNHDHIWRCRQAAGNPIWGSYSNKCYQDFVNHVGRQKLPPARVLDIGCGAGACGMWFHELGYEYVGLDESENAIDLGRQCFPKLSLHHEDFLAEINKKWRASFDVAVSINVLHCLTEQGDRLQFLTNAKKTLVSGGSFIFSGMCLPKESSFKQADSPRCYKTVEDIMEEVTKVGFRDVEVLEFLPPSKQAKIGNTTLIGTC